MKKKSPPAHNTILTNKRGLYGYTIIESVHAGIKLSGNEVKSLKTGCGASLLGAFVSIDEVGKVWIRKMRISRYQGGRHKTQAEKNTELQTRELLLQKNEIIKLGRALQQKKGLTILPISLYTNPHHRIIIHIALVQKIKKYDHRKQMKERDDARHIARVMKAH